MGRSGVESDSDMDMERDAVARRRAAQRMQRSRSRSRSSSIPGKRALSRLLRRRVSGVKSPRRFMIADLRLWMVLRGGSSRCGRGCSASGSVVRWYHGRAGRVRSFGHSS